MHSGVASARRPRRVLIVGGAGFVGARLARACLDRGDMVHLMVRPTTGLWRIDDIADRIAVHVVGHQVDLPALIEGMAPDHVYHLATATRAPAGPEFHDVDASLGDLGWLVALVTAAARCRRPPQLLVRAGSLAEYGPGPVPFVETQREQPLTPYAAMLVAGTHSLAMLRPRLPFATVTARLALLYGPRQSTRFLVPALIRNCLAGRPTRIERPGDRRDLLHVDDAVAGLLQLGETAVPLPAVVNLATGVAPRMIDVAAMIADATGAPQALIETGAADTAPAGGTADLRGSTLLAERSIGWRARIGLAEGLAATVAASAMPADREMAAC